NLSGLESMQFISTENGQIKLVAATDVEINDGTLYTDGAPDVDAAAIRIEAGRTIQVGPGAVISAEGHGVNSRDGAIELVARSTVASDGEGAETGTSIDVLGGEIRGGSILLQAAADADFAWEGSDSIRKESG